MYTELRAICGGPEDIPQLCAPYLLDDIKYQAKIIEGEGRVDLTYFRL